MRRTVPRTGVALVGLLMAVAVLLWPGASLVAGVAPTLGPDCGSEASIVGTDQAGKVTVGNGVGDTCTLTFTVPMINAPACMAMNETNSGGLPGIVGTVTSTTALVLDGGGSKAATLTEGDVVSYLCVSY